MFRSTFLHEKVNYGRFYELAENDLDMHAMFLKIINDVCRKIIISPVNIKVVRTNFDTVAFIIPISYH
jgi:hypothetical protein